MINMDSTDSPLEAVTGFYHEHGIEHRWPSWEAFVRGHGYIEETVSQDPLRHHVSVLLENDELCLTLDEHVEVIDVTR